MERKTRIFAVIVYLALNLWPLGNFFLGYASAVIEASLGDVLLSTQDFLCFLAGALVLLMPPFMSLSGRLDSSGYSGKNDISKSVVHHLRMRVLALFSLEIAIFLMTMLMLALITGTIGQFVLLSLVLIIMACGMVVEMFTKVRGKVIGSIGK